MDAEAGSVGTEEIESAWIEARRRLMAELQPGGFWRSGLSSSALSTAVAAVALRQAHAERHRERIERALRWLERNRNSDGGWGDTPDSPSNLSTTLLCWSALAPFEKSSQIAVQQAGEWIDRHAGGLAPERLAAAVVSHYGRDRTFSAPILALCAVAGRLGPEPGCWRHVPQLPFEMALLSRRLLSRMNLSVVSYALPALIAIGAVRFRRGGGSTWRGWCLARAVRVLDGIQPENGGFLEAAPLTGFVVMGLAAAGFRTHPAVERGADFLARSAREDGSWPIDTNLDTWVTTLAVSALAAGGAEEDFTESQKGEIARWLAAQQWRKVHPFTGAEPGGWAWTNLPGGVPDADDTAGALLALRRLAGDAPEMQPVVRAGLRWLARLQNRDGGLPTFCRGWGRLPFDRSCPDITAHGLAAMAAWAEAESKRTSVLRPASGKNSRTFRPKGLLRFIRRCADYLEAAQRRDGAWVPLWFGDQNVEGHENPVYGTARVLVSLREAGTDFPAESAARAREFLKNAQNEDGGWGGSGAESGAEETAMAVWALAGTDELAAATRGAAWLARKTRGGREFPTKPIGLYFASLWYSDRMYPLVFSVGALGCWLARNQDRRPCN